LSYGIFSVMIIEKLMLTGHWIFVLEEVTAYLPLL